MNAATEKQVSFLRALAARNFKFSSAAQIAAEAMAELEAGKLTTRGASIWIDTLKSQATV